MEMQELFWGFFVYSLTISQVSVLQRNSSVSLKTHTDMRHSLNAVSVKGRLFNKVCSYGQKVNTVFFFFQYKTLIHDRYK